MRIALGAIALHLWSCSSEDAVQGESYDGDVSTGGSAGFGGSGTGGAAAGGSAGSGGMPDPCADHCDNGSQDCGETGTDCGGMCSSCSAETEWGPEAEGVHPAVLAAAPPNKQHGSERQNMIHGMATPNTALQSGVLLDPTKPTAASVCSARESGGLADEARLRRSRSQRLQRG